MRESRAARAAALVGLLGVSAPALHAREWELGLWGGRSIPTYEQTFTYNPGRFHPPIPLPGLSISEAGSFGLTGKGGLAFGGSLTFFPTDSVGFEARVDTLGLRVDSTGLRYTAAFTSSFPPLPSFTANLDLPPVEGDVDRLTPVSVGLRLRTPGRVRLFISAGVGYLPKVAATATQTLAFGLANPAAPATALRLSLRAEAQPGEGGRWGVTGGAGIQVALSARASLLAEGRVFRFQTHTLEWSIVGPAALTGLEDELRRDGLAALDPVEFKPTFYQVTAGLALRF